MSRAAPTATTRLSATIPAATGTAPSARAPRPGNGSPPVFFGEQAGLADRDAIATYLAPLRKAEWVVYAKRPFGGPEAVLAYLSRYTHRVAISNSRLVACDENSVTLHWKNYRARGKGAPWLKTMTLAVDEFIRRFLIHVLPSGFHRIRHYGLFASGTRAAAIARIRELLGVVPPVDANHQQDTAADAVPPDPPCPCCGGRMIVVELFGRITPSRATRSSAFRFDTS